MVRHFKIEGPLGAPDLDLLYPQDPPNVNASVVALLEARRDDGWELYFAGEDHNGNWRFVYVADGKQVDE
jgi:hypothetical protein